MKSPQELGILAQRLVQVVSEPYLIEGHMVIVGSTIGIGVTPTDGNDPVRLLRSRPGSLPRQGRRQVDLSLLRAGNGRPGASAPPARDDLRSDFWPKRSKSTPAPGRSGQPGGHRLRGPATLAASDARLRSSLPVRAPRRGNRPHHAARQLRIGAGLPRREPMAPARQACGQPVAHAVPRRQRPADGERRCRLPASTRSASISRLRKAFCSTAPIR